MFFCVNIVVASPRQRVFSFFLFFIGCLCRSNEEEGMVPKDFNIHVCLILCKRKKNADGTRISDAKRYDQNVVPSDFWCHKDFLLT